jgi:UDP-N-acetylmuramoyl-L-alanyl-D-glutamate--2,6-diaminopimelate ligase
MKLLKDILYKVSLVSVAGDTNVEVGHICFDSRQVKPGSLFIAVKGTQVDGHTYIDQVVASGARAVVCEHIPENTLKEVTYVVVPDSAKALGFIASNFYDNPSAKLKLVAITGTNGKTTTVTLLHALFRKLGYNVGLLSTVNNKINEEIIPSTHTTPDAISLNALMKKMLDAGCTHCFMEASSHAIVQGRIAGIQFAGAVFSNITHDHLDYHKTFDEYIKAKKKLFDDLLSSAFALTNVDDKRGMVMLQNSKANKHTYGLKNIADFKARIIANSIQGLQMEVDHKEVWFKLIGDFNAYNLMAAYGAAVLLGENPDEVLTQLSDLHPAPGRFERVIGTTQVTAIVDYAHTPDALENVLNTIKELRTGNEQVITVVGCGGNRDKTKRPVMADIACKLSDRVILTSDNPRDEEPEAILADMQAGVSAVNFKKTISIVDRREAIKTACAMAGKNDIILVAGKGHETYQEVKGVKHDFDDRKVLKEMLDLMGK